MQINNLSFKFNRNAKPFFSDLSFEIQSKTVQFLQGKNGSGKSTLFRILQGALEQQEVVDGTINIDAVTYQINNSQTRNAYSHFVRHVQQDFDRMLADQLNFKENLALASMPRYPGLHGIKSVTLPPIVSHFGIDSTKPAYLLSGGQRQILAILMVLQKPTKVLLLDEPTAALDEKNSHLVIQFLQELVATSNLTILIITHDKELVKAYAHGTYLMLEEQDSGIRTLKKIDVLKTA